MVRLRTVEASALPSYKILQHLSASLLRYVLMRFSMSFFYTYSHKNQYKPDDHNLHKSPVLPLEHCKPVIDVPAYDSKQFSAYRVFLHLFVVALLGNKAKA